MTDGRWPRVKALFQDVVARPAEERDAFLAASTAEDAALRSDVESLLRSDASDGCFLDQLPAFRANVLADLLESASTAKDAAEAPHALVAGVRIGPYEVVGPLAAGAMGEVYGARDTTLNRIVALKVLPQRFALDPDRSARFTREAQLLAALNHPHIGAIYGFEETNGTLALVLELVEGRTLAERIALGAIPLDEALTIARQMAEALEAAHEKGIVHRDLKPANIKLTRDGVVKVLDFGLARVWDGAPRSDLSESPKLTDHDLGTAVLGTPAYMSPEQARGQSLDRRTDVWSFGCVFYEMLTGRAPFAGDTISDTLAAILEREPDWTMLPAATPAPLRRLLRRCLEKDRKKRLDSASDARLEIEDAIARPASETLLPAAATSPRVTPAILAALAGVVVTTGLVVWILMRPAPTAHVQPARFAIVPSPGQPLNVSNYDRDVALSPDGHYLVYRAGSGPPTLGTPLMLRAIDDLDARQLPGIFALGVFFSPDSRWVGFFTPTELKKVRVAGGPAITIAPVTGSSLGASWGDDNSIVFATNDLRTGLLRVAAEGGEPSALTMRDATRPGSDLAFPSFLPGGRGVLFTIMTTGQPDASEVAVLDLKTGQPKTLIRGGSDAHYVETGHLVFAASGALRAVRFDPVRLEVLGDPVTVVEGLMTKPSGAANYAVSRQGTLFYVPGGASVQHSARSLVWVDRKGQEERINAPMRPYGAPHISPDGTRVLLGITDLESNDAWIWDFERETLRRVTFGPGVDALAFWTPDGRRIIFESDRTGESNLYSQAADGTGTAERLTTSPNQQFPTSISPDGKFVVGFERLSMATSPGMAPAAAWRVRLYPMPGSASRLGRVPLASPTKLLEEPPAQTLFDGGGAEFSPNGRYLAYQSVSGEPGPAEIYVRPFPDVDSGRWQISTAGGTRPTWARSGRELFYLDASNTLTAVTVQTSGSTFRAGKPAKVFDARYATPLPPRSYDVSPDGKRFLMLKDSAAGDPNAKPLNMVLVEHWFEELKRRVNRE
jgi:serine/threonine-protein kinase